MGKRVVILSGVSGSGKSTVAKELADNSDSYVIVSADDFFWKMDPFQEGDFKYCFNASQLSEAHGSCFHKFIEAMHGDDSKDLIIVDNTNTTSEEIAPYILGASAFGYEYKIITVSPKSMTDLEKFAERNNHGVPMAVISAQFKRICNRSFPPWWKSSVVEAKF